MAVNDASMGFHTSIATTFLSKANDYFSHMDQRWESEKTAGKKVCYNRLSNRNL